MLHGKQLRRMPERRAKLMRTDKRLASAANGVSLRCDLCLTERDVKIEFEDGTPRAVSCVGDHFDARLGVQERLVHCRATKCGVARSEPVLTRLSR